MKFKADKLPESVASKLTLAQKALLGLYIPPQAAAPVSQGVEQEGDLHDDISAYCRKQGWLAFHGSMAHKSYRTLGEPDWILMLPKGRTLFVECKTAKGKLSPEQLGNILWAEKLGHKIHVVRSMTEFLEAVTQAVEGSA